MNPIHGMRDCFVIPETGRLNGPRVNNLIMTVSAVATLAIGSWMAEEYLAKDEVSYFGAKCFSLISVAVLESGSRRVLLKFHKQAKSGFESFNLRLPSAAFTVSGLQLFIVGSIKGLGDRHGSEEQSAAEAAGFVISIFVSSALMFCGVLSLFVTHRYSWQDRNHHAIELLDG